MSSLHEFNTHHIISDRLSIIEMRRKNLAKTDVTLTKNPQYDQRSDANDGVIKAMDLNKTFEH